MKACKADGDLSRYFPNILPITSQSQIAGKLPGKVNAQMKYLPEKSVKKTLENNVIF